VDGQAVVDEVGGEESSEVVGCEVQAAEGGVGFAEQFALSSEGVEHGAGAGDAADFTDLSLEQVGQRCGPDPFVAVVTGQRGDRALD
jgi:hypothetical protein